MGTAMNRRIVLNSIAIILLRLKHDQTQNTVEKV